MEWQGSGYVLTVEPFGETSVLLRVFAADGGIRAGLVKGGRARASVLQPGNRVHVRWRARLSTQLGQFITTEPEAPIAARALPHRLRLSILQSACALVLAAFAEHDPHPRTFAHLHAVLHGIASTMADLPLLAAYAHLEMQLLNDAGYSLQLDRCALSGTRENLAYVSPRSGRAISAAAAQGPEAAPHRHRLLPLPAFLLDPANCPTPTDIHAALRLTGHFLRQLPPRHGTRSVIPAARDYLLRWEAAPVVTASPEP